MRFRLPLFLLLLALLPQGTPHAARAEQPVFEETFEDTRGFRWFGGPSRQGPEHQWQRVQDALERNRTRRAIRLATQLVRAWPDHPLAPKALILTGELHTRRDAPKKAFDAYQTLIDSYAGQFDYQDILDRQLALAENVQHRVYRALLTRYRQPEDAIPLYQKLITNAPHADITPELLFRIGQIHLEKNNPHEAIAEFNRLEDQYPGSPFAPLAAWHRAKAFESLTERFPTDNSTTLSAYQAYLYFTNTYPNHERAPEAHERMIHFYNRAAAHQYRLAVFYQENMDNPEAARVTLESLLQTYAESDWAVKAADRLETIKPTPTLQ